jgi:predicted MFS family arabinose efflux permease
MLAGMVLTALALPLLVLPGSFILEAGIMALLGAVMSVMLASAPQELTDEVDRRGGNGYGTVYALYNVALSVGMMVGPVAGGILAGYLGLGPALVAAAACLLIYAAVFAISSRVKALEAPVPTMSS